MKAFLLLLFFFFLFPFVVCADEPDSIHRAIQSAVESGNFNEARTLINQLLAEEDVPPAQRWNWELQKEILDRIELDFSADKEQVQKHIERYFPDVTPEPLARWKMEKALEVMTINGQERYFRAAANNFFRISKEAKEQKQKIDGIAKDSLTAFLETHTATIQNKAEEMQTPLGIEPRTFRITYTLTIPADTVPAGEVLRCWLPFPHRTHRRQTEVKLLESNIDFPVLAPPEYEHSTLYGEKIAVKGEPAVFRAVVQFKTTAEFFDLSNTKILPYNKKSERYQKYTAERSSHIIFTPQIKALSRQIVGEETNPVNAARKIFDWITSNIPWASAREYSTMDNIPSYVLENKHGDCGMVSLLFVTLCRYNGIPAKWQSGFMLHPGNVNLHDWAEVYFEGTGWVPVDTSFGSRKIGGDKPFFFGGMDSYRWIVNEDYSMNLFPAKIFPRSETVDFQRGETEWRGGNLYFNRWKWDIRVEEEK